MTVLEALKQAIDTLNGISVPVPQLQSIGMPISQAISLVQATMDAIDKNTEVHEDETEEAEPEESEET